MGIDGHDAVCFNTQPPEGGWAVDFRRLLGLFVSTHSRPKAAGSITPVTAGAGGVSTHSRPKAAGLGQTLDKLESEMFQHTAARRRLALQDTLYAYGYTVSTHSRPKAAGTGVAATAPNGQFQHTAARRRLEIKPQPPKPK